MRTYVILFFLLSYFSSFFLLNFLIIHASSGRFYFSLYFTLVLLLCFSGGYTSKYARFTCWIFCLSCFWRGLSQINKLIFPLFPLRFYLSSTSLWFLYLAFPYLILPSPSLPLFLALSFSLLPSLFLSLAFSSKSCPLFRFWRTVGVCAVGNPKLY